MGQSKRIRRAQRRDVRPGPKNLVFTYLMPSSIILSSVGHTVLHRYEQIEQRIAESVMGYEGALSDILYLGAPPRVAHGVSLRPNPCQAAL
jgi:hypothetical protein